MKHLIKNNEIVRSGIPSHFTRKNGEGFWGGYENRTDLHQTGGCRRGAIPALGEDRRGQRRDTAQELRTTHTCTPRGSHAAPARTRAHAAGAGGHEGARPVGLYPRYTGGA